MYSCLKQRNLITMIWKSVIFLSVVLCVLGDEKHATSEQKVMIRHKKISHIGSKMPEHHEEYAWSYPSYEFSYKVDDPYTKDKKGQSETREGDEVKGEYWLMEPGGRKRLVKYYADKEIGFKADVEYSEPLKHIFDDKDYHMDHHADEAQKGDMGDQKKEDNNEEQGEQGDDNNDRDGVSSQHMPLTGQYRPMPYRPAVKQFEVQENYHNPRFYRHNRRQ